MIRPEQIPAAAPARDLVKRLRQLWSPSTLEHPLMTKAAAEIRGEFARFR